MFEGYELVVYSLAALAFTIVIVLITAHVQGKDDKSA